MRKLGLLAGMVLGLALGSASAAEYECPVDQKFDGENVYTPEQLAEWRFSVRLVDDGERSQISRCSFNASEGKIGCDTYAVDYVEDTGRTDLDVTWRKGAIKKFYHFASGLDVQLFLDAPGLPFVENNGRGTISFGKCERVR